MNMPHDQPNAAGVPMGRVRSIWRYPVSSAAGQPLDRAVLDATGIEGDRQFAMVDARTGETASPERYRRWQPAPLLRARMNEAGRLGISRDGAVWHDPQGTAGRALLERHFDFPVEVRPYGTERSEHSARPRYRRAPLHLLTTASLGLLQRELPESTLSAARFRPNILLDAPDHDHAVEQEWMGRLVTIAGVTLRVVRPCGRCSFTTLAQDAVPYDRNVLKQLIRRHDRQFGVLCEVEQAGTIRVGDAAALLPAEPGPA